MPAKLPVLMLASWMLLLSTGCERSAITTHEVHGTFVRPAFDGEAMRVDHEAIPGVMDAMTMDFRLRSPGEAEGLEAGDRIRFLYVLGDGPPYARDVRRVDPAVED